MKHADPPKSRCRFGIATGDMTPPVGIYHRMWGAAKHDRATGVHRPLRATAMAIAPLSESAGNSKTQILIAIDHCILGSEELGRIENAVQQKTGLSSEQIVVVCSHTHAAGLLSLDRANLPGGELISDYLDSLAETAAGLVQKALVEFKPATISYGVGSCRLAANRDFWDEDSGQFVCGLNPEEDADNTLVVARVIGDDGKTLATMVNYACHPTTLAWDNTLISPDYPGAMRELVESQTSAPCLFLQGASGELGPREGFVGDLEVADRNGRQLGYAALAALESLHNPNQRYEYAGPVVSGATIGTWAFRDLTENELEPLAKWSHWRGEIDLPYRDLPPMEEVSADLKRLEAEESAARSNNDAEAAGRFRALAERRRRELARRQALPPGETYPYQAAIWRIGEAVWVAIQGEPYSLLQTELRKRFPDVPIVVASIGFSWGVAYLPPADKYGLGLYQENIAIVAPGALETLIDRLADQIECLLDENP